MPSACKKKVTCRSSGRVSGCQIKRPCVFVCLLFFFLFFCFFFFFSIAKFLSSCAYAHAHGDFADLDLCW